MQIHSLCQDALPLRLSWYGKDWAYSGVRKYALAENLANTADQWD